MRGVTMELAGVWRYPVKSLQGEALDSAYVEGDGLLGDRRWGIRDQRTGRILTARRRPELLEAAASYDGNEPLIVLPDGRYASGPGSGTDRMLSEWLGSPVTLVASAGSDPGRAEYFADATDDTSAGDRVHHAREPVRRRRPAPGAHDLVAARRRVLHPGRGLGPTPIPPQPAGRPRPRRRGLGGGRLGRADAPDRLREVAADRAVRPLHHGDPGPARAGGRRGCVPHSRTPPRRAVRRVDRRAHHRENRGR